MALLDALTSAAERLAAPFVADAARPAEAAVALAEAIEALARGPDGGGGDPLGGLWGGLGRRGCGASLVASLIEESDGLPDVSPAGFVELVEALIARETVRGGGATHPRLRILGAIEARLARADLVVLAGLEEGVWPQGAPVDPFLSRPMRTRARPAAARAPPRPRRARLRAGRVGAGGGADRHPSAARARRR